jgi:hypothetical protein
MELADGMLFAEVADGADGWLWRIDSMPEVVFHCFGRLVVKKWRIEW